LCDYSVMTINRILQIWESSKEFIKNVEKFYFKFFSSPIKQYNIIKFIIKLYFNLFSEKPETNL
jgi:hypothetical protein